ncbi:class I SAM-dependent methyltransferase [Cohnella fermenti]|uniref:Class I SAM-dependent methyltransferase n=1 Tax=Cohnella fermenti TaxID=2565925 RepID=A0A4S4BX38_9BACL|nr:class I SAM-dependent methyltransferase [Cohnella fermenti]THF79048.1 class I SAM-dependent methyltransferase [Cohnella fermenti]
MGNTGIAGIAGNTGNTGNTGIAGMELFNYFLHNGKPLPYNRIPYNNCSERAIELPLALEFLERREAGTRHAYLEIGNVLNYYKPLLERSPELANRTVIDKFEQASGVVNVDLMEYERKHDTVVCISTLEHVGQHAYGEQKRGDREAPLRALRHVYDLLGEDGEALVTVPFGKLMDLGWLIQFSADYLDLAFSRYGIPKQAMEVSYFRKLDMEMQFDAPKQSWIQCDRSELAETRFDNPFVFANGIAAIRLRKRGTTAAARPPAPQADAALAYHPPVIVGSLYTLPFNRPAGYDLQGKLSSHSSGYVFYGPFLSLQPGAYLLQAEVALDGHGRFTLELTAEEGCKVLWSRPLSEPCSLEAVIHLPAAENDVELRLYKHNDSACRVRLPKLLLTAEAPIPT